MKKVELALLEERNGMRPDVPAARLLKHVRGFSPSCLHLLQELKREIGTQGAGFTEAISEEECNQYLTRICERSGFELTPVERDEILAEIELERRPFGLLQSLVDDPKISDIIVSDSSRISVQCGRQNFGTGLHFPSQEIYEAFVERLLQRAEATYSTKKPIVDGAIGGFARVHAVHSSLCDTGPYLTIRLNRYSTVTSTELTGAGLAPKAVFDYLETLIAHGQTVLIVGEVGTGKTTLARALATSVPAHESILVIEDTPEIKLQHPHVRYISMREANSEGSGRVSPSECIRAGMRMAMNRIIFGEIRDAEAAESFIDVCASGHPGLSTIHARSAGDAITRLELFLGRAQRGAARSILSEQIATAVQVIVFVNICKITGRRRVMEVKEIGPVADGVIRQRDIFKYQLSDSMPRWRVQHRVSAHRDLLESSPHAVVLSQLPPLLELDETGISHD